jgi:hypothetical protein
VKHWFLTLAVLVAAAGLAYGEIPQVIGYQGRVTDNSGNPVADGTYSMRFRIYDNSGGSGSPEWDSGTRSEQVEGGVFSVMLGESPHPALNLAFDQDYWLAVTFDGEVQLPLKRLASTGYAYMASGLVPGTVVSGSVTPGSAVKAVNTATSAVGAHGLYGETQSASSFCAGVYGRASSTAGSADYGVVGESECGVDGIGVWGKALATDPSGTTYGVWGMSSAQSGTSYGLYGDAQSSDGYGVYGRNWAHDGTAVYGEATDTAGSSANYGVFGRAAGDDGTGVHGQATHPTGDTRGGSFLVSSPSGTGVYARANATTGSTYGVRGVVYSGTGQGVYGEAELASPADGIGVHGVCTPADYYGYGVIGEGGYIGVWGICQQTGGSHTAHGLYGYASGGATNHGVYGVASGGSANWGVYASGDMGCSGAKPAVVRTDGGPKAIYAMESPELWFEDFGTAVIYGGRAHVQVAPDFLQTVTIDADHPMRVFVTPKAFLGAWWVEHGEAEFTLMATEAPDGAAFDYRVLAKRRGYEDVRLRPAPSAYTDHYLYPELADVPAEYREAWLKSATAEERATYGAEVLD